MNAQNCDPKMWQLIAEYGNAREAAALSHDQSPTLDERSAEESDRVAATYAALWAEIEKRRKDLDFAVEALERDRKLFAQLRGLLGTALSWIQTYPSTNHQS